MTYSLPSVQSSYQLALPSELQPVVQGTLIGLGIGAVALSALVIHKIASKGTTKTSKEQPESKLTQLIQLFAKMRLTKTSDEQTGPKIAQPKREMFALDEQKRALLDDCDKLTKQNDRIKTAFKQMNYRETFVASLPSPFASGTGYLLNANMFKVNAYNKARHQIAQTSKQAHLAKESLETIDRQYEITDNLLYLEGALAEKHTTKQNAEILSVTKEAELLEKWNGLKFTEKLGWCFPTHPMRKLACTLLLADFDKVTDCVDTNEVLSRIKRISQTKLKDDAEEYRKIFSALHEKISIASPDQIQRSQAKDILQAYKLASKLHVAANNAWAQVQHFNEKSALATIAERSLSIAVNPTADERSRLEQDVRSARTNAEQAYREVKKQMIPVQNLAKQLNPFIVKVQNHYSVTAGSFPHWNIFQNTENLIDHPQHLQEMGAYADGIRKQLEINLVYIFNAERLLHTENDPAAYHDALTNPEPQKVLRDYLIDWAAADQPIAV